MTTLVLAGYRVVAHDKRTGRVAMRWDFKLSEARQASAYRMRWSARPSNYIAVRLPAYRAVQVEPDEVQS